MQDPILHASRFLSMEWRFARYPELSVSHAPHPVRRRGSQHKRVPEPQRFRPDTLLWSPYFVTEGLSHSVQWWIISCFRIRACSIEGHRVSMSQLNIHAQSLLGNNHCLTCHCFILLVYSILQHFSTYLIQALLVGISSSCS